MLDAIAARSRLAVLRRLDQAPSSSATELAGATGLHLNTVRSHLQALESAGIVEGAAEHRERPGRPTIRYRLRERVVPAGEELLPLSSVLAEALASLGPGAEDACRAEGAEWGRRWSRRRAGDPPAERVRSALERLGFAAVLDGDRLRLTQCPCPLVARGKPQLVCELADSVADGVLEGTSLRVVKRRHDPKARDCTTTVAAA